MVVVRLEYRDSTVGGNGEQFVVENHGAFSTFAAIAFHRRELVR